jgi:predicted  nucleic acid-binding Zn ribbon protein
MQKCTGIAVPELQISYGQHVRTIYDALQDAKHCGFSLGTIQLMGLEVEMDSPEQTVDSSFQTILVSLCQEASALRVLYDTSILNLMAQQKLNVNHILLESLYVDFGTAKDFFSRIHQLCSYNNRL